MRTCSTMCGTARARMTIWASVPRDRAVTRSCCSSAASVPSCHAAVATPVAFAFVTGAISCALRPIASHSSDAPGNARPSASVMCKRTPDATSSPGAPTHTVSVLAPSTAMPSTPTPTGSSMHAVRRRRRRLALSALTPHSLARSGPNSLGGEAGRNTMRSLELGVRSRGDVSWVTLALYHRSPKSRGLLIHRHFCDVEKLQTSLHELGLQTRLQGGPNIGVLHLVA